MSLFKTRRESLDELWKIFGGEINATVGHMTDIPKQEAFALFCEWRKVRAHEKLAQVTEQLLWLKMGKGMVETQYPQEGAS
jgi:hypothetical protein